jgi:hypothetical protein
MQRSAAVWPRILTGILLLIFVVPTVWSVGAVVELVAFMGRKGSNYPAYGTTPDEVLAAYTILLLLLVWTISGTIVAIRVLRKTMNRRWLQLVAGVSILVLMPLTVVFLLGAGRS